MTKEEYIEIDMIAEKYSNLSHEDFDGNIDWHYKTGFWAGYLTAVKEKDELQKKVYELENDFMAIQEEMNVANFNREDKKDNVT